MINFFNNKYYKNYLFRYVCSIVMENKIVNILVIFGATGDLASRKIFPAINEINKSGNIPENFHIIGCGRKEIKTNIFNDLSSDFSKKSQYLKLDPLLDNDYKLLVKVINDFQNTFNKVNVIFYLSTPPSAYKPIINNLIKNNLNVEGLGYRRIIVEKPFGRNLESAKELNNKLFVKHALY